MRLIKYKLLLIMVFITLLFCLNIADAKKGTNDLPLFGKVITIDPGHG